MQMQSSLSRDGFRLPENIWCRYTSQMKARFAMVAFGIFFLGLQCAECSGDVGIQKVSLIYSEELR